MKDYLPAGRLFYRNLLQFLTYPAAFVSRRRVNAKLRSLQRQGKKTSLFSEALSEGIRDLFREMGYPREK